MLLLLLGVGMCLWPGIVLTAPRPDHGGPPSPHAGVRRMTEVVSVLRLIVDTEAWPLGRRLAHHPGQRPLLAQHCARALTRRPGLLTRYHCSDLITRSRRPHHSPRPRLASAWPVMRRPHRPWPWRPHQARRRPHGPGPSHVRRGRPEARRRRMMRASASHARMTSRREHWTSEPEWRRPHARGRSRSSHPEWHRPWHSHEWRSTSHPRERKSWKPWPSSKVSASSKTVRM